MPLQATSGAASYDAFGGGVPVVPNYIEDVFSTWLYSGTGASQTITNGIDLSGKGGLVWIKNRSATSNHVLGDTARNANYSLASNLADAETFNVGGIFSSFNSNGFSIGTSSVVNASGNNFTSWSFRKSNKFYTQTLVYHSNGTPSTVDLSSLGTVGAVLVKSTNVSGDWYTWHRSLTAENNIRLNTTAAQSTTNAYLSVSGTTLTISSAAPDDFPYVVYAFAHDAGGFGLTGTDNVISCGSFTADVNGNVSVTLGYEPQWVMVKRTSGVGDWLMFDTMRGMPTAAASGVFSATLLAQSSVAEDAAGGTIGVNATGFNSLNGYLPSNNDYIYIAIRRGPMKVPTSGTSVFSPIAYVGANGAAQNISAGFPVDMDIIKIRNDASRDPLNHARLMGGVFLATDTTGAQQSYSDNIVSFNNAQNVIGLPVTGGGTNEINGASTSTYIAWAMRRAPSFMDVVCYTGTGSVTNYSHNLSAVPELMIMKKRSATGNWIVYSKTLGVTGNDVLFFNSDPAGSDGGVFWNSTVPTSSVFTLGTGANINGSGVTFVAYLFATCAGVSKVGSYTGNGTTQTIDCGFTGGARFVLIKRTDDAGDWYVYDTARGMTVLTDPYLLLNTTAAEVATLGSVTTVSTGFALNSTILAAINVSAGTYIFLAIA